MATLDDITLTLVLVVSFVSLGLSLWAIISFKQKLEKNGMFDSSIDTLAIIREFSQRLKNIEVKVVHQTVALDLLKLRSKEVVNSSINEIQGSKIRGVVVRKREKAIVERPLNKEFVSGNPTVNTLENEILLIVSQRGSVSGKEVQLAVNRSREHTARMLGSLFRRKLLLREASGRGFVYSLSEEGRLGLEDS
ncbi:MAG TPA: hypothetical protein VJN71_04150 [Nitrososphaerales archaeon]|nr:hypothetical protein [Nitrososphaerales archaeon]